METGDYVIILGFLGFLGFLAFLAVSRQAPSYVTSPSFVQIPASLGVR
jgi:hypothetical protein